MTRTRTGGVEIKSKSIPAGVIIVLSLAVSGSMARAAPDKYTLRAANDIAFSEFRGYEDWQPVAVSEAEDRLKVILANPVMIDAFKQGIPGRRARWRRRPRWSRTPSRRLSSFAKTCHGCHTIVRNKDYIFTSCQRR